MRKLSYILLLVLCGTMSVFAQDSVAKAEPKEDVRKDSVSKAESEALLRMEREMQMLSEVVVKGVTRKLIVKEDTFIYNANAYKTPEGSTIEELVRRLPGAQVGDDGKITINGKEVKKIMVDGKEFMTGDTQTAMKNLPTSIIDKVKAYDERSDMSKMTGVDDGEEEMVLDFNIKKGMNKGFMGNIDLGIGTKERYAEKVMGAYMKDNSRLMFFGNFNNVGDRGFTSGGRGGSGGGNGLQSNKMLGLNYNYEKKDKFKADLSVRWNHGDTDTWNSSASENFVSTAHSFSNSMSQKYGRSNSWNISGRMEWKPDSLTTITFRPQYTGSTSDSRSTSADATFSRDPYTLSGITDPLQQLDNPDLWIDEEGNDIRVNSKTGNSLSYSASNKLNLQATFSRKLAANGRNVSAQVRYQYTDNDSESLSSQLVNLYKKSDSYYKNRYNLKPTDKQSVRLQAAYMEPIAKKTFLQLRYQYTYSNNTTDRATYDFSNVPDFYRYEMPEYRDFDSYVGKYRPLSQDSPYYSMNLSKYSEYDNYNHEIELTLKRNTNKYRLNVGVLLQPQSSRLNYRGYDNGELLDTIVKRTVTNFTPTLDFRYKWNKQKNLRLNYRGSNSLPSMTDMLPIVDDTDPLNIKRGNPGLKPSFVNNFRLQYNNYISEHVRTIMAFVNYQNTRNAISNKVTYNDQTGGRESQPENIDGNWNINGAFMLNTALDSLGNWNMNTFTSASYVNDANYAYLADLKQTQKNYTRTTALEERLGFSYRNDWLEVELNGQATYNISRNKLQEGSNMNTWQYQYGTDITLNAPWGMSLSTGAHMQSRRGFAEESMNTNEFIWNAQIAQSFLKGKPLTVSLQFYDILGEKSSFSRAISATQRTDSWYNNINSYCMLHVIYRFNVFGGKQSKKQGDDDLFGGMPPAGRPDGMGGRPDGMGGRPDGMGGPSGAMGGSRSGGMGGSRPGGMGGSRPGGMGGGF